VRLRSKRRSRSRPRSPRARPTTSRTTPPSSPNSDEFSRRDIEFHRATAASYDDQVTRDFAVYHERLLWPFLDRVADARPGGRVLDLGCGTGVVSLPLAKRGFDVVGIDHSPEMLELARQKLTAAGVEATFETGDVRALRFGDAEFDCVTIQGLLHHLEELDSCLAEMVRALRPGGFFYISEPTRDETPLRRLLRLAWSKRPRRRPAVEHGTETVEEPISVAELRSALDALSVEYEVEFLTHLPPLRRRLPDRMYLAVSRALTRPWRERRGDLVFVFGTKPAA
jgi:ubiquinone/menaquinone biosynthesis C-methylase UbiE